MATVYRFLVLIDLRAVHCNSHKFTAKVRRNMGHTDGESPSDDENRLDDEKKLSDENGQFQDVIEAELPPDPDAHLTEAERIKIVCTTRDPCGWIVADAAYL